jgi:hypothetical protein
MSSTPVLPLQATLNLIDVLPRRHIAEKGQCDPLAMLHCLRKPPMNGSEFIWFAGSIRLPV